MASYTHARLVFLRLLGVVYLCAFASLTPQIAGLVGPNGILPAGPSDAVLRTVCVTGVLVSVVLIAGVIPIVAIPVLWLMYGWLSNACADFLSFQWDALLLETGMLAILVAPLRWRERWSDSTEPPRVAVWLMWWLLFRLMFGSGAVKLASGDPTWRALTAMTFHYETQPIPNPLAFYAHHLPVAFNRASTALTLAVELVAPLMIVGPRRVRLVAAALLIGLQLVIAATGNFAFFNLLSIALCVWLVDDASWPNAEGPAKAGPHDSAKGDDEKQSAKGDDERLSEKGNDERRSENDDPRQYVGSGFSRTFSDGAPEGGPSVRRGPHGASGFSRTTATVAAVVIVPVSLLYFTSSLGFLLPGLQLAAPVAEVIAPLRSVNSYGLFAVMTTTRPEIIVEGSDDGEVWKAYEFAYKPGDLGRRPPIVAPHQPRLDWQMWFAALGRYDENPWFQNFCVRVLQGSPEVLGLLARDPFNGRAPKFVRAELYRYRFADMATHRASGVWWTRERLGDYSPVLALR